MEIPSSSILFAGCVGAESEAESGVEFEVELKETGVQEAHILVGNTRSFLNVMRVWFCRDRNCFGCVQLN